MTEPTLPVSQPADAFPSIEECAEIEARTGLKRVDTESRLAEQYSFVRWEDASSARKIIWQALVDSEFKREAAAKIQPSKVTLENCGPENVTFNREWHLVSTNRVSNYGKPYARADEPIVTANVGAWYETACYWRIESEKRDQELQQAKFSQNVWKNLAADWERVAQAKEGELQQARDRFVELESGVIFPDIEPGPGRETQEEGIRCGLSPVVAFANGMYQQGWQSAHDPRECGHPAACWQDRNYPQSEQNYDPETRTSDPPMEYRCVICEAQKDDLQLIESLQDHVIKLSSALSEAREELVRLKVCAKTLIEWASHHPMDSQLQAMRKIAKEALAVPEKPDTKGS